MVEAKKGTMMTNWIAWAGGILGLVATLWGGFIVVDTRYAKAQDTRQQVGDLKGLYLRSEQRALEDQRFRIQSTGQQRRLTELEQQRLKQIDTALQQIQQEQERNR